MIARKQLLWATGAALTLAMAGGALIAGTAFAQSGTPGATATTTPGTTAPAPTAPDGTTPDGDHGPGGRGGMRGGMGGHGDFGGPGMGGPGRGGYGPGGAATADGATNAISSTTSLITSVKSDLAYANGKMDTTSVQNWVNGADSLLAKAQSAQTAQQYGQAVAYAQAARELAETADQAMAQALGATNLPSYANRPQHGPGDRNGGTATAPTQAQVSRELKRTYEQIVSTGATASGNADASAYVTEAQNAYKTAYSAYNSGDYTAAHNSAQIASSLLRVAESLLHVADAGTGTDTPVTVPAPTF